MKILVVEDEEYRRDAFRTKYAGQHQIVFTKKPAEAIDLLKQGGFGCLFLDHDLGCKHSGYDIACWLEEHPEHCPPQIVIHSQNSVGNQKIKAALPQAYLVPFAPKGLPTLL